MHECYNGNSMLMNSTNDVPYHNVLMPSIFGVICFCGIIGNCIVIYTITVPDIIFSLSLLLGNGSWCFSDITCTVITALDSNSQIVSTYILTVMTLDRYLATVHPIRDGSVVCSLLLPNPATDTYWFTLYQFVLAFALPLVVICVVFFKILQNMSATVAPLPQSSLRVRTRKVTCMAVAICLAFFICWAPYYILQLAHLRVQRPSFAFLYVYNIAISMGYANSCVNPYLYIVLSETFKRQFIVAIRPNNRVFRLNSGMADGSVSLRLAPECNHRSQSSRDLLVHNMLQPTVINNTILQFCFKW
uniref:Melanin concentrating hormone receptor 1 n=1 Tax=Salmo trutta TaxID=8032 RepID=A0A673Y9T0_SALTR